MEEAEKDQESTSSFKKEYAAKTLGLFNLQNRIRRFCITASESDKFDRFILFLILLNTLFLAMNDYSYREKGGTKTWRNEVVEQSELWFLIAFSIEAIIKIIALGFISSKEGYLRDPWNVLDFLVVVLGWIGLLPGVTNLTALRAVRVLRPLRSINAIRDMKILVKSLLASIPALANVVIFLLFIFIVFGIIGVNFFSGGYYQRCRYTSAPEDGNWDADPAIQQL
jgi:hypothetical protein